MHFTAGNEIDGNAKAQQKMVTLQALKPTKTMRRENQEEKQSWGFILCAITNSE